MASGECCWHMRSFRRIFCLTGAIIAAFSIEEFLVPCTILDGGIVGISIMINNLTKIPLGGLTLVLNLPFLIVGMRKLGIKFIAKSAAASTVRRRWQSF